MMKQLYYIESIEEFLDIPYDINVINLVDENRFGRFIRKQNGTPNNGTIFQGTNCLWHRQYSGLLNVLWFGANTTRLDNQIPINQALRIGDIFIPDDEFTISDSIEHLTSDRSTNENNSAIISNGRRIVGASRAKSIIKQGANFPAGKALINLDGNSTGSNDYLNGFPYSQSKGSIENLSLRGRWIGENDTTDVNGLRLRAITHYSFSDLCIENFYGTCLKFVGSTVHDDIDTSMMNEFSSVLLNMSYGYGIYADLSRIANTIFTNLECRYNLAGGYIGGGAGVTFNSSSFSLSNGYGALIKKPTSGASPRGINFNDCMLEGNKRGEINGDYADSININDCTLHPFIDTLSTKIWNEGSIILNECASANIIGNRIQPYSTIPEQQEYIDGIVVKNTALAPNVNIMGNSIATAHHRYKIDGQEVNNINNLISNGISFFNDTEDEGQDTLSYNKRKPFVLTSGIIGNYTAFIQRTGNMVHFEIDINSGGSITSATLAGIPFSSIGAVPVQVYADGVIFGDNKIPNFVISGSNIILRVLDQKTGLYSNMTAPFTPTSMRISGMFLTGIIL